MQQATSAVADAGHSFWSNYLALRGVAAENDALHKRVLELEGQMQAQAALLNRTHELERILKLKESLVAPTMAAA